jgi:hypothetical protein
MIEVLLTLAGIGAYCLLTYWLGRRLGQWQTGSQE